MLMLLLLLVGNERRNKEHIHIEVLDIREKSMTFKAVSPLNQGLPFGSRFLAEDLTRLGGGNYELRVLGEGTIGERIFAEYLDEAIDDQPESDSFDDQP